MKMRAHAGLPLEARILELEHATTFFWEREVLSRRAMMTRSRWATSVLELSITLSFGKCYAAESARGRVRGLPRLTRTYPLARLPTKYTGTSVAVSNLS